MQSTKRRRLSPDPGAPYDVAGHDNYSRWDASPYVYDAGAGRALTTPSSASNATGQQWPGPNYSEVYPESPAAGSYGRQQQQPYFAQQATDPRTYSEPWPPASSRSGDFGFSGSTNTMPYLGASGTGVLRSNAGVDDAAEYGQDVEMEGEYGYGESQAVVAPADDSAQMVRSELVASDVQWDKNEALPGAAQAFERPEPAHDHRCLATFVLCQRLSNATLSLPRHRS